MAIFHSYVSHYQRVHIITQIQMYNNSPCWLNTSFPPAARWGSLDFIIAASRLELFLLLHCERQMPVGTAGSQRHKCQKKERLEMPWWGLLEDTRSKVVFFADHHIFGDIDAAFQKWCLSFRSKLQVLGAASSDGRYRIMGKEDILG